MQTLFDKIGGSTRSLLFCFFMALGLAAASGALPVGGKALQSVVAFLGGAVLALAVASWQLNGSERALRRARDFYWESFSSDAVIYLATRPPDKAFEAKERSPLTPFHDALAAIRIQEHLLVAYKIKVPIISVGEIAGLGAIRAKNVILVGGPNLNHLTRDLMSKLWKQRREAYFHWSSTLSELDSTRGLVRDKERDHFLKLQTVVNEMQVVDEIFDRHDTEKKQLVFAYGMCLRLEGVQGRGSQMLLVAGAAAAYGTLAAANYVIDPRNLTNLTALNSQLIVSSKLDGFGLHDPEEVRAILSAE